MFENTRKKYNDLLADRAAILTAAETALNGGDQKVYQDKMTELGNVNTQLEDCQKLIREEDRFAQLHPHTATEQREKAEARAETLRKTGELTFDHSDVMEVFRAANSTTLATGGLVEPTGNGTTIREKLDAHQALIDQVSVMDLTGVSLWEEPYVKTELTADSGKVKTKAGTLRTDSDPSFGKVAVKPYEVTVTSYVDRNIQKLTNVAYYDKIYAMAMKALRKKVNQLIISGDGQSSPDMYGIKNAVDVDSTSMTAAASLGSAISADTLDNLVFAYGSDDMLGGVCRLLLTKANLKSFGQLRDDNGHKLMKVTPTTGNPNTGMIDNEGLMVPYNISSNLTATDLLYGDPANYLLGLFGNYTIRVDESYKAGERMLTILGDVFVGGNVVVPGGWVVGTLSASSAG